MNIVYFNTRRKRYRDEPKWVYLLKLWIWWNMKMKTRFTFKQMNECHIENYDYTKYTT